MQAFEASEAAWGDSVGSLHEELGHLQQDLGRRVALSGNLISELQGDVSGLRQQLGSAQLDKDAQGGSSSAQTQGPFDNAEARGAQKSRMAAIEERIRRVEVTVAGGGHDWMLSHHRCCQPQSI